jgi:hypothetical protein
LDSLAQSAAAVAALEAKLGASCEAVNKLESDLNTLQLRLSHEQDISKRDTERFSSQVFVFLHDMHFMM